MKRIIGLLSGVLATGILVAATLLQPMYSAQALSLNDKAAELYPKVDGAVKSRFLMRVGWVIIVHVYFTRPTDRGIV